MWKWLCEMSGVKLALSVRVSSPVAAFTADTMVARHPSAGQALGSAELDADGVADTEAAAAGDSADASGWTSLFEPHAASARARASSPRRVTRHLRCSRAD